MSKMKLLSTDYTEPIKPICVICGLLLLAISTFAQGLAPAVKPDGKADKRPAQELFEEANGYLGRRFQEFNKQKLPYNRKSVV